MAEQVLIQFRADKALKQEVAEIYETLGMDLPTALLSKRADAATVRVIDAMFDGRIVPLYHEDILAEYDEVLHRSKFHFKEETIQLVINAVKQYGVEVFPQPTGEILIDMDDLIFYEVAMEKRDDDAYLVTGNQKHYPIRDFIVTPAEMMEMIDK